MRTGGMFLDVWHIWFTGLYLFHGGVMRGLNSVVVGCLALVSGTAVAQPIISAAMTCDNAFTAYISTDPNTQGTAFLSGSNWAATFNGSTALNSGAGTYYLHIFAEDFGLPAAFIGGFSLDSTDAIFANGTQTLLTNTVDWQCNTTGWGTAFQTPTDLGVNGVGPWGFRTGIDQAAHWIWDASNAGTAYFTTSIRVIPAPGAGLAMIGGLVVVARRRR